MTPRLSIIPAGAIFDRTLDPRDLQVLALLGMYTDKAGWCRRSQVKMAGQLKCGRSSVQRSLENLVVGGWVEKKRPPWSSAEGQPSNSYMYRVILDRDDSDIAAVVDDDGPDVVESHAETATQGQNDQIDGNDAEEAASAGEVPDGGVPTGGHPGAQTYVGTGAQPYVGTKNDPLERPLLEREREARARDRAEKFLAKFESQWPSAVADDRQRTAYAAAELTESEEQAALAGIDPFLASLKRLHRKAVPAGWRYLEEKRWTLLETAVAVAPRNPTSHAPDSTEARAIKILFKIAKATSFFFSTIARGGAVNYRIAVTPRFAALAQAGHEDNWPELNRQQAAAWEAFLREFVTVQIRHHMAAGDRAPWPWPPSVEGKVYTAGADPPDLPMSDEEAADFR